MRRAEMHLDAFGAIGILKLRVEPQAPGRRLDAREFQAHGEVAAGIGIALQAADAALDERAVGNQNLPLLYYAACHLALDERADGGAIVQRSAQGDGDA